MKIALCIAAVIAVAIASPGGYYHQEYNYKTSSSSFKNNELQRKTDDQGYYSKAGDLEGRVKPKVSSNSEHSEYVNPSLREPGSAGYYDIGSDLTSHGNMLANSYGGSVGGQVSSGYHSGGSQYGSSLNSEGLASSDYLGAASGYSGSYSSGSQAAYESASLRTLGSQLQNDLQSELQSAIHDRAQYVNVAELETELRRNLTARLNEILNEKFGTQTIRSGQSYSLVGGQLQSRPNYNQQELDQLQQQIERSLLEELRQGYNYRTSHTTQQRVNQNYERFEATTTYRPNTYSYRPIYPNLNTAGTQNQYTYGQQTGSVQNEYNANRYTSNVEYTQVPNAASITTIASNVQRDLNTQLNRILEEAQRQYFSENSRYNTHNTASVLDRLKQELRSNLTYALDEEIRRNFGTQLQKSGHMFTIRQDGGTTNQYNYNVADLESLKRQVEENLITKLTRDFETARQHWISRQQSQQSQQNIYQQSNSNDYVSNHLGYDYTTARYSDNDYYRPTSASIIPLISSGVKGNKYQTASGSQFGNYETSGSSNIAQLQRQLQADLGGQLQAALSQNSAYVNRYSTGDSRTAFDEAYRRLYEELQRNLTQQLQSFEAGSSAYSNSYGSVSENQLAQLKSQLQNNLASQLQQGLRQSYSASASYSASSGSSATAGAGAYSSSNSGGGYYRAARGSDSNQYGQYRSGGGYLAAGEDCQGDDPLAHQYHRSKRSYGYRSRTLGLSTHTGAGYESRGTYGDYPGYGRYTPVGQEEDNSEIEPLQKYSNSNQGSQNLGQEIDDSDDTQQIEVDPGFGQPVNQLTLGQEEDNSDDTQQIQVDHGFSSIGLGSQSSQINSERTQKPSLARTEGNLGQNSRGYTQESIQRPQYQAAISGSQGGFGYSRIDAQSTERSNIRGQIPVGQEEDDSDDTQQIQIEPEFSPIGLGSSSLQVGSQGTQNPKPTLPRTEEAFDQSNRGSGRRTQVNTGSAQQTNFVMGHYHPNFPTTEKSNIPQSFSYKPQSSVGQEEDDSDYLQQIEDNNFGGTEVPSQNRELSGSTRSTTVNHEIQSNHRTYERNHGYINQGYRPYRPYISRDHIQQIPEPGSPNQGSNNNDNVPLIELSTTTVSNKPINQQTLFNQPGRFESPNQGNWVRTPGTSTLKPTQIYTGQEVDDTDTIQQISYGNNKPNYNGQFEDFDAIQNSPSNFKSFERSTKPGLNSDSLVTPSTPKNQVSVQFGTQNVVSENESVQPLHSETVNPQKPSVVQSVLSFQPNGPTIPVNDFSRTTARSPRGDIPAELEEFSTELKENLTSQINEIVKNNLPSSGAPSQLYNEILYNLRTNISRDCQKILKDDKYSNLNINQRDIDLLEKRIESHLTETVNSYFSTSGTSSFNTHAITGSFPSLPQVPAISINPPATPQNPPNLYFNNRRDYWQHHGRRPKPQVLSNTFLQREINAQDDTHSINQNLNSGGQFPPSQFDELPKPTTPRPVESNSFISQTIFSQTLGQQNSNEFRPQSTRPIESNSLNSQTIFSQPSGQQNSNEFGQLPRSTSTRPIESNPLVIHNTFLQDSGQQISNGFSSTTPIAPVLLGVTQPSGPAYIPSQSQTSDEITRLRKAENEADILIQKLSNHLRDRQTQHSNINQDTQESFSSHDQSTTIHNQQPQSHVIRVKLEHITPEQLNIINQIENDFSNIIDLAVQDDYTSVNLNHQSKYELYRVSLNKLEEELRQNLSDCIKGTIPKSENVDLQKYSDLVHLKFKQQKISDLQKYLEIRLIKKIRAQLQKIYNIEAVGTTYESESTSKVEHTYQKPIIYEARVVTLQNITPAQLNIIQQIENDIMAEIEAIIQIQISSLKQSSSSSYYYEQSLKDLEVQLKNNVTERIQRICEPGLSQYYQLIVANFDKNKISDLENYLEIKLINKVAEKIMYYSESESTASSHIIRHQSSGSSDHFGSTYHSYNEGIDDFGEERVTPIRPGSSYYPPAANPATPLHQTSVKGGSRRNYNQNVASPETEIVNESADVETVEKVSSDSTLSTESTTPAPGWWKRFGNKVKQGASKLKEKITGQS